MGKPLSRKQHGVADYVFAATELSLVRALDAGAGAKRLLAVSGANAALLGMVTKHELGLVKLVPMRVHLALDAAFAATFVGAAAVLDESRRVKGTLAALGIAAALITALTDRDRA